jgi:hypothetical protein
MMASWQNQISLHLRISSICSGKVISTAFLLLFRFQGRTAFRHGIAKLPLGIIASHMNTGKQTVNFTSSTMRSCASSSCKFQASRPACACSFLISAICLLIIGTPNIKVNISQHSTLTISVQNCEQWLPQISLSVWRRKVKMENLQASQTD